MRVARLSGVLVIAAMAALACADAPPPAPPVTPAATPGIYAWQKIYDRPANSVTTIDMFDDEFGLAVIAHTLQRTDDGGRRWQQIDSAPADVGSATVADRLHWWVFGTPGGMMRTDDGGATWRPQDLRKAARLNSFSVVDEREVWATAYDAPYQGFPPHGDTALLHTVDGGDTWTSVAIPGYGVYLGAWFIDADGWVIATQCHPGDPTGIRGIPESPDNACFDVRTLLHTPDAGASWEVIAREPAFIPGGLYNLDQGGIQRIDRDHAFAICHGSDCDIRTLYVTTDGGRSWEPLHQFNDYADYNLESVKFVNEQEGWAAVINCGTKPRSSCEFIVTYRHTTDAGNTWQRLDGIDDAGRVFDATASRLVAANTGGTGISYFDGNGGRWEPSATNAGPEPTGIEFSARDAGYARRVGGRLSTLDGGETWFESDGSVWWGVVGPGIVARWPANEPIQISRDDGRSWQDIAPPGVDRPYGRVTAVVGNRIWVQTDGVPWSTDDGGNTWHRLIPWGGGEYHVVDENRGWFGELRGREAGEAISLTTDGGATWEVVKLPYRAGDIVFRTPLEGWTVTHTGGDCLCVLVTRDGGHTWGEISTAPWVFNKIVPTEKGDVWGLTQQGSEASVVVRTSDNGGTWVEDHRVEGAFPTDLITRDNRLWLYYTTSKACFPDGPCEPPRGTVTYRRDIAP